MDKKIKGSINSHIQLPKSVLKGFSFKEKILNDRQKPESKSYIYCMDMNGKISKIDIKDANTEFGYYENCIEAIFSDIESRWGEIRNGIIEALNNKKQDRVVLKLPDDTLDIIKKYFALCVIRSEALVKEVQRKSVFMDCLENSPANAVVYSYMRRPEVVDNLVKNKDYSIMVAPKERLILPQSGFYAVKRDSHFDIIIPISPKYVIRLTYDNVYDENKHRVIYGIQESDLEQLNNHAIMFEVKHNQRAIYSRDESILVHYKEYMLKLKGQADEIQV